MSLTHTIHTLFKTFCAKMACVYCVYNRHWSCTLFPPPKYMQTDQINNNPSIPCIRVSSCPIMQLLQSRVPGTGPVAKLIFDSCQRS